MVKVAFVCAACRLHVALHGCRLGRYKLQNYRFIYVCTTYSSNRLARK